MAAAGDSTVEGQSEMLKYLKFVESAAVNMISLLSCLYEFAMENSGPLKYGVQTIDGVVKTVMSPLCEKFHGIPFQLLKLADDKVDAFFFEMEKCIPEAAKTVPKLGCLIASEVRRVGLVAAAMEIVRAAWMSLNRLPLFSQFSGLVMPPASSPSERKMKMLEVEVDNHVGKASSVEEIRIEEME